MNDMIYTYQTTDIQRVPGHRTTEPTMRYLFGAIRMRDKREKSYNGHFLTDEEKEEYLDSIKDELKARSRALKPLSSRYSLTSYLSVNVVMSGTL